MAALRIVAVSLVACACARDSRGLQGVPYVDSFHTSFGSSFAEQVPKTASFSFRKASGKPQKPGLLTSFWATVQSSDGNTQDILADQGRLEIGVSQAHPNYSVGDGARLDLLNNKMYSRQRFFGEAVCYKLDMDGGLSTAKQSDEEQRDIGEQRFQGVLGQIFGVPLALYDACQEYEGEKFVHGGSEPANCSLWSARQNASIPIGQLGMMLPQLGLAAHHIPSVRSALLQYSTARNNSTQETYASFSSHASFCVNGAGQILQVNVNSTLSVASANESLPSMVLWQGSQGTNSTFRTDRKPTSWDFTAARRAAPQCVDLTRGHVGESELTSEVNSASRIARINSEAAGHWNATAYGMWNDTKVEAIIPTLGTEIGPLRLLLRNGLKSGRSFLRGGPFSAKRHAPLPAHFDPRTKWPMCNSIGTIRNQGECGSCWAFSAAAVLSDRFCIASVQAIANGSATEFSDVSLAPGHLVDCDPIDNGCSGGRLDDVWWYLRDQGVPLEQCRPYRFCPDPNDRQCQPQLGSGLARLASGLTSLRADEEQDSPGTCNGECLGTHMRFFHASEAYAVSAPSDLAGLQRELFTHGPVQVALFVFSDFQNYKNGVYFRTPGAFGPLGGHAVRLLGWGNSSMPYWLVANTWSPQWGLGGNFQMRRGTNECGIETTPAAGHANLEI